MKATKMKKYRVVTRFGEGEAATVVTATSKTAARRAVGGTILSVRQLAEEPQTNMKQSEFYIDFDDASASWCVFHTEGSHAYASYSSKEDAEGDPRMKAQAETKKNIVGYNKDGFPIYGIGVPAEEMRALNAFLKANPKESAQ